MNKKNFSIRTKKRKEFRFIHVVLFLVLFVAVTVVIDLVRISNYEVIPKRPLENIHTQENQVYYDLVNYPDSAMDWSRLDGTLKYIQGEYDCSDFDLVNIIRILYHFGNKIPVDYKKKMEVVLLNFRYWWDEPGANSMCYWSENHQILFASAEYLIGQLYPETVFPSSGLTGLQHMKKAGKRAHDWLEMRWNYGFTEYNSEVYYTEDIGALMNLIDFAEDEELEKKASIIMDLLFYDLAVQNVQTMMISTSGRAYQSQRIGGPHKTVGGMTRYYFGDGQERGPGMTYGMTKNTKYRLPAVLKEIALDTSSVVIKQSNGLDIPDLKIEGYNGTDNRSMMMQWGMECFTNPEIIRNSLSHIRKNIHFSNEFIADFKMLDFTLLKWFHLEPLIVKTINPQTNGIAIQKGNTYTYKTNHYSMYTSQSYHPGKYGDQHHIFGLNIKNHFSVFHNHPALEKDVKNQSPNYWVGYGHLPHSVQDKNVNLSIYKLPKKKGMMELALLDYTRAYFPSEKFDTALIDDNYAFGKKDDTYCALIGLNRFEFRDDNKDDIIQKGKQCFWISEVSSEREDGSFKDFVNRIRSNKIDFNVEELDLTYKSNGKKLNLKFKGDFKINGEVVDTNYDRYDSPYTQAKKKDKSITYQFNGKKLFLDFENLKREYN